MPRSSRRRTARASLTTFVTFPRSGSFHVPSVQTTMRLPGRPSGSRRPCPLTACSFMAPPCGRFPAARASADEELDGVHRGAEAEVVEVRVHVLVDDLGRERPK